MLRRRVHPIAVLVTLALVPLLAACGQSASTSSGPNGAHSATQAPETPSAQIQAPPSPTDIPPPYAFPKQWKAAPDGADLPQSPASMGSFVFSPSSPQTGYFCVVSPDQVDDSPSSLPAVSVTVDGGRSWQQPSEAPSRYKTTCQMFIDQNNPRDIFVAAGNASDPNALTLPLFRSQDGGATWTKLNQPTTKGATTFIVDLAVVQSRLLIMIAPAGAADGPAPATLYASDDGGQSWKQITLSVNGQIMQMGQLMWVVGPTIYIGASAATCASGCGAMQAPAGAHAQTGAQPLNVPLSSGPQPPTLYFKSLNGARTWSQVQMPASNVSNLTFTRSADGFSTYVLGTVLGPPGQSPQVITAYYSKDGGANWRRLPTLVGAEHGYPDPGSLGAFGSYILPDGAVITTAFHTEGTHYGGDAGVFLLRPDDAAPAWRPLVRSVNAVTIHPVVTSTGIRVWGLTTVPEQAGGFLEYFDLP